MEPLVTMTVVLETQRLYLRPFVMDDLQAIHAITTHPDVWEYDPGYERTLEQTRDILIFRIFEYKRHGLGRLALVDNTTHDLIGYAGLQLCMFEYADHNAPEIEFFYGLARTRWGEGLVIEAGRALIRHGFEDHQLKRILSCADAYNTRSINVMKRLGMTIQPEPCHPDYVYGVIERS